MAETIPAWVDGKLVAVDKLEVHRRGLRHPAVSVFLLDGARTLIQRRALASTTRRASGRTPAAPHPRWGEDPAACAARRLREELGIEGVTLVHRDTVAYVAPVGGRMVENEEVELFTAEIDARRQVRPDPAEVMATRWIGLAALRAELAARPRAFTPWLGIYFDEHSGRLFGRAA